MKNYQSKDVKEMNTITILKALYKCTTATIPELMELTGLSQSTVRSILLDLEAMDKLIGVGRDASSGGRCPIRYSFHPHAFRVMGVYLHKEAVEVKIYHVFYSSLLYECVIKYKDDSDLYRKLNVLVQGYFVSCISFGVPGIVDGYDFYTDEETPFKKHTIVSALREKLDVPILVENDVRTMLLGYRFSMVSEMNNIAYLYLDTKCMGSAFFVDHHILQGKHHYAGEIGLIPYRGKSINDWLQISLSDEEYCVLMAYIFVIVASFMDPEALILCGKNVRKELHHEIMRIVKQSLDKQYEVYVEYHGDDTQDIYRGLHHMAITRLLEGIENENTNV